MIIQKTYLATHGQGGGHQLMDTNEYEGNLWLLPEWLDAKNEGLTMPVRMVRPLKQTFQKTRLAGSDHLLSNSMPTVVFQGHIPPGEEDEFEIVEGPPIHIRGGHGVN